MGNLKRRRSLSDKPRSGLDDSNEPPKRIKLRSNPEETSRRERSPSPALEQHPVRALDHILELSDTLIESQPPEGPEGFDDSLDPAPAIDSEGDPPAPPSHATLSTTGSLSGHLSVDPTGESLPNGAVVQAPSMMMLLWLAEPAGEQPFTAERARVGDDNEEAAETEVEADDAANRAPSTVSGAGLWTGDGDQEK